MLFDGFTVEQRPVNGTTLHFRRGGKGPPLLLLHGYPQTHVMWHTIAGRLAREFSLILPDLRGYGDSGKPTPTEDHFAHSKRMMARDVADLMRVLGHERFMVAGHDRGGRVTHRLALDHPDRVLRAAILDIVPTHTLWRDLDHKVALAYYHWMFLAQPGGYPEYLIGKDPMYCLERMLGGIGTRLDAYHPEALAEYRRCFCDPSVINGTCEDYRAGATIDVAHDTADLDRRIACPLLVLWGSRGLVGKAYDPLACWREKADDVRGQAIEGGHFLVEENPDPCYAALKEFFSV